MLTQKKKIREYGQAISRIILHQTNHMKKKIFAVRVGFEPTQGS